VIEGEADQVAGLLEQPTDSTELTGPRRTGVEKAAGYLRAEQPYLGYDIGLAENWLSATGVIEGACRHLVKDRMDIWCPLGPGRGGGRAQAPHRDQQRRLRGVLGVPHAREHLRVHAVRYRDPLELAA
jgi:hypothetical protein